MRQIKLFKRYTVIGIFFVMILGSVWHFVYEWSGNNFFVGFFFPINESVWEHMKLLFFPMLLYSLFMITRFKDEYPCISSAYSVGILTGTMLIPIVFYTYTGILGRDIVVMDFLTFAFSIIIAFYFGFKLTVTCKFEKYKSLFYLLIIVLTISFILFTYLPPNIGLFTESTK